MKFRVWRAGHAEHSLSVEIEAASDAEAAELFADSLAPNVQSALDSGHWIPVFVRELSKSKVPHPIRLVMLEQVVRRNFHARTSFWLTEAR